MPRYAQLVIGPAGSGKSSYCAAVKQHCAATNRMIHVVNLDPAAEHFDYEPLVDIRELIQLDDAMQEPELHFGPNGGLVFCMEFLIQNLQWLDDELDEVEDDYILFDCPGQIELYSHLPVMRQLVEHLEQKDFRICAVFLLDSRYLCEATQLVSGAMAAMSAMISLESPHVNVMSKVDLLTRKQRKQLNRYLEPDLSQILAEELSEELGHMKKLHNAIAGIVEDYGLLKFMPVSTRGDFDEELLADVLLQIDMAIQYGEDLEPKNREADMVDSALAGPEVFDNDD